MCEIVKNNYKFDIWIVVIKWLSNVFILVVINCLGGYIFYIFLGVGVIFESIVVNLLLVRCLLI